MKQIELFGAGDLAQPAKPRVPPPKPAPERVRRYLNEDLAFLRYAQITPWADWEVERRTSDFAALADELEPEEAPTWKARWNAEIERLRAARASGSSRRALGG